MIKEKPFGVTEQFQIRLNGTMLLKTDTDLEVLLESFLVKHRTLTLLMHLDHVPSFLLNPGCHAFSFVSLYVSFQIFHVKCDFFPCLIVIFGIYSFDFHSNLGSLDYSDNFTREL